MLNSTSYAIEHPLRPQHQNQWCFVLCTNIKHNNKKLPYLVSIHHQDSQEWEETQYLHTYRLLASSWKGSILYIPQQSDKIRVTSINPNENIAQQTKIIIVPLSRWMAASLLAISTPISLLKKIWGSPKHLKKRLRIALNQNYTYSETHLSYKEWCSLYDDWNQEDKTRLSRSLFYNQWPVIHLQVYCSPNATYPDTEVALDQQWKTPKKANQTYIAILQSGEILPPHALSVFADQAAHHHFPEALYADSDIIDQQHQKAIPQFKPNAGYPTLLSGLLTQDIWLFRKDIFDIYQQTHEITFSSAYTHRLALALYIWQKRLSIHHVPFILSHRHVAPSIQTIKTMQQIAQTDLSDRQWQGDIEPNLFPLKIKLSSNTYPVSLIIPTTISSKIVRNCIRSIITNTNYEQFEIILVISQSKPLTRQQIYYLRPLLKHNNLRVVWLKTNSFNFSQSCNFGIQHAKHNFIGIINDDISPKTSQWLVSMMGHMQDPQVGAVGAKLYYPNGQIQHAGIIMGAANLCEHAGRFQQSERYNLTYDHDVSAVTGACMLIRRKAYEQVQGFDENYEIAYNDIDFCLKLRHTGFRVIQCQQAELIHYESLSLGNHYTGKRAGKERQEILSLRSKWKIICENDPFYNPNLSLQRGMDGKAAFPPRITRPFATPFLNK